MWQCTHWPSKNKQTHTTNTIIIILKFACLTWERKIINSYFNICIFFIYIKRTVLVTYFNTKIPKFNNLNLTLTQYFQKTKISNIGNYLSTKKYRQLYTNPNYSITWNPAIGSSTLGTATSMYDTFKLILFTMFISPYMYLPPECGCSKLFTNCTILEGKNQKQKNIIIFNKRVRHYILIRAGSRNTLYIPPGRSPPRSICNLLQLLPRMRTRAHKAQCANPHCTQNAIWSRAWNYIINMQKKKTVNET